MTNPWHHHAPGADPRDIARLFAGSNFDLIELRLRRVERFGGRWDTSGCYHGVFVVEGEDREFELSGDADGNWSVMVI